MRDADEVGTVSPMPLSVHSLTVCVLLLTLQETMELIIRNDRCDIAEIEVVRLLPQLPRLHRPLAAISF